MQTLGCLAFAADLSMGQPIDHSPRTALLARKLTDLVVGSDELGACSSALSLIRWAGCTANAQGFADLFGDDIRDRASWIEGRNPFHDRPALSQPLEAYTRPLAQAHCEATIEMSRQLGLSEMVAHAANDLFEHWDGTGIPGGRRGEEIHVVAQIVALCGDLEVFSRVYGIPKALALLEARGGRYYDPALARSALKHASGWLAEIAKIDAWPVASSEASPAFLKPSPDTSVLAALLADYADLKLPADFLTSRRVAEVATLTALLLGFDAETVRRLTTAALLHGLGRVAVPNGTLERRGPMREADEEHIRLVPHWTERILKRASVFDDEAKIACRAFERLDGSGYPRGLVAPNLDRCARILQACVFVVDVSKPEREASGTPGASALITKEVVSGRLDADATNAVLAACGMPRKTIAAQPAASSQQVTQREQEVLAHLARGRSNKEIARTLGISPSTAGTHVENIYRKLGVGTRAAAALVASKRGLVI
jgi:HD-GYP domain-containing protein (c-di-GMP phosphodiesterase class II)